MKTLSSILEKPGNIRIWNDDGIHGVEYIYQNLHDNIDYTVDSYNAYRSLLDALDPFEASDTYLSMIDPSKGYGARALQWIYIISKFCPLSEKEGPFSFSQENDEDHPVWYFSVPFDLLERKGLIQKRKRFSGIRY